MSTSTAPTLHWSHACRIDDIAPWCGVAALFGQHQVAIIRWGEGEQIHALDNFDPFSDAYVISRGIVGDHAGVPTIASPMYKQRFRLTDGTCVEDASVKLAVYPVRIEHGDVFVGLPA